jgi:Ion channel
VSTHPEPTPPASTEPPDLERRALRQAARASDSYGLLLALLLVNYVLLTAFGNAAWVYPVRAVVVGATVLLAFHTSHVRGRWLTFIRIVVGIGVAISVVAGIIGSARVADFVGIILGVLIAASPVAILTRILHHERVGPETILGAVCVYVLLGIVFAFLDLGINAAYGPSHPFFVETNHATSAQFIYFSYVTLTTTGYGDLSPSSGLPQTAAVFEALAGQIFLVTLVARMVALYRPRVPRFGEPPDGADVPTGASEPDPPRTDPGHGNG